MVIQRNSHQQVFDLHWQFTNTNARCVVDRRGDRSGNAGQADLADPARTKFVDLFVGVIEEMHLDRRRVGIHCHDVVRQITVDRRTILRIVSGVLQQRHADSHHDPAHDLVPASKWINNSARIHDGHNAADAQPCDLRLPCHLNEMTAKRVR